MIQPDMFTARDEAIDQADQHADHAWKRAATDAVRKVARMRLTFTADEVWDAIPDEFSTHEPAALGPVILAARKDGLIEPTGEYRPSKNARRHRDLKVWRATPVPLMEEC